MAAIDTVTGISLLYDSVYEVTSNVTIGTVDDVTDATFIIRNGGLLRFGGSCATTFTRCTFIETDTAYDLGFDHYYLTGNDAPRWDSNCTAVFKGCKWLIDTNGAFDTHGSNACTWEKDDYGNPCYFHFRTGEGSSSLFQITDATVDGVVFNMGGTNQLSLAGSGVSFNDFNYDSSVKLSAQMTFPYPEFQPGGIAYYIYNQLKAPSVDVVVSRTDVAPNEHSKSILQLIDPIGRIEKTVGSGASNSGVLEVYRTWQNSYLDALTGSAIGNVRALIHPLGDVTDVLYDQNATTHTYLMKQFSQAANTETVVTEPDYVVITMDYGYLKQVEFITVDDTTNPDAYKSTKLLFSDSKITETNGATVAAYSTIDDASKFYDAFRYWEYTTPVYLDENNILTVVGSTLNWSDHNIYFGNFSENITHFGDDYVTPVGETIGDEASTGLQNDVLTSLQDNQTYTRVSSNYSGWATYAFLQLNGFEMSPDGTKIFTQHAPQFDSGGIYVTQLTLSTAYDLSTATVDTTYKITGRGEGESWHMSMNGDGTLFTFIKDATTDYYTVTLGTAYDWTGTVTVNAAQTAPITVRSDCTTWNDDGTKMYCGRNYNYDGYLPCLEINEYTVTTPYTPAGATLTNTQRNVNVGGNNVNGVYMPCVRWADSGETAVVFDGVGQRVQLFSASTAYDLSTINMNVTTGWNLIPNHNNLIGGMTVVGTNVFTIDWYRGKDTSQTFYLNKYQAASEIVLVGAPDSIFVNVGTDGVISSSAKYDTIQTTGTVYFLHGTSTDMTVVDSQGTLTSIDINGLEAGSRIQLYNVTQDTELVNTTVAGTSYSYSYYAGVAGAAIVSGDVLRVRATKIGKLPYENTLVSGAFGGVTYVSQDDNTVYNNNSIDGSTVTEFTYDLGNVEIDVNDPDGVTTVQRMYAWYQYFLTTETGIRDGFNGFVALDEVNYEVRVSVLDMNVQNVGTNAVTITGGRFYRDDGNPVFIAGSGPIQMEYGRAYAIETGVSGLTSSESTKLMSLDTTNLDAAVSTRASTADLSTVNSGVKKASKLIPHSQDV